MAGSNDRPELPWLSDDGTTRPNQPEAGCPEIEGYQIIGPLGRGGMGTVWRAVQQSTGREVALKVLGWVALGSERARARFEREVELASRLEHPHITRVYDSGLYHGVYYYAMELVDGMPLDQYAAKHGLDRRLILSLVRTVCRAVQHAHQRSMIHRDLKPSNILVTEDGQPHILDFGLAKVMLEEDAALTVSASGDVVGTPAYMAPEQAAGRLDLVDTRSDVYSLGVIAYELLAEVLPHDLAGTRQEVLHRIATEEPKRPRAVARGMDKELEALLLKALAHDPDGRYDSAGALADDIDRYLSGEPLLAQAPTTLYFLRKRLWKYRVHVAVVASVLAVLVGMAVWSYGHVVQARDEARQEAAKAKAVAEFLDETFTATDPSEALGREVTVRDVLDRASKRVDAKFAGKPLLEAEVRQGLAFRYAALEDYGSAQAHLASAVDLRRRLLGDRHRDTLTAQYHLGNVLRLQGKTSEATPLLAQVLEGRSDALGKDHPDTLLTMNELAKALVAGGRRDEGESLQRRAVEAGQRVLGKEHPDVLALTTSLADILWFEGKRERAMPLYRQVVEVRLKAFGEDHPGTISSLGNLASALWDQGEREEALALYRRVAAASRRALGEDHPGTLHFVTKLADALTAEQAYDEAEQVHREELQLRHRVAAKELSAALVSLNELANDLRGQGKYIEAEQLHTAVLRVQQRGLGEDHAHTLVSESNLAQDLYALGHYEEAERLHRRVLAVRQRTLGGDNLDTLLTMHDLANDLYRQAQHVEAKELLTHVYEACCQRFGVAHREAVRARLDLALVLQAMGREDEAEELRRGAR